MNQPMYTVFTGTLDDCEPLFFTKNKAEANRVAVMAINGRFPVLQDENGNYVFAEMRGEGERILHQVEMRYYDEEHPIGGNEK